MMASKGWKAVQPHVPLIKFRKGGTNRANTGSATVQSSQPGANIPKGAAASVSGARAIALPTIEDYQLPSRYQRRPIDMKEIEYINRGGPE